MLNDHPHIAGVLVTLFGLCIILGGVVLLVRTRRFLAHAVRVPGLIVDVVRNSSGDSDSFQPVFRFRTLEGEDVEAEGKFSTSPSGLIPGRQVPVLYVPGDPHNARVDTVGQRGYLVSGIMVCFGLLFTCVGVAVYLDKMSEIMNAVFNGA